jgi:Transposase DDE domain
MAATRTVFIFDPPSLSYSAACGGGGKNAIVGTKRTTEAQCQGCSPEEVLYARSVSETVCSLAGASATDRALAGTPAYKLLQRTRYRIEALFAELKQWMRMHRVRLRRTWNVAEQFLLAATAQNLKRLVRFLAQREAQERSTT